MKMRPGGLLDKALLRPEEAAELLFVSKQAIYNLVDSGTLEGTLIGRTSLRIFATSLTKLIEKRKRGAGAPRRRPPSSAAPKG
jgi:excisionase family DNA binding protein